jgi:capsule polysaccharide modification protein KpsS
MYFVIDTADYARVAGPYTTKDAAENEAQVWNLEAGYARQYVVIFDRDARQ